MTSESNGENLTEIFQILTSLVFMKNLKKCFKNFNLKIFQIHKYSKNVYREKRSLPFLLGCSAYTFSYLV